MIEILNGVFYDPAKEWYEQPQELIDLGLEIEQTIPIGYELQTGGGNTRALWSEWETETECGVFKMKVEMSWMFDVSRPDFMSKTEHNKITIIKIS